MGCRCCRGWKKLLVRSLRSRRLARHRVTAAGGQPLAFERYAAAENVSPLPLGEGQGVRASQAAPGPHPNPLPKGGTNRRASASPCPRACPIGEEFKVNFRAVRTPPGWLAEWPSAAVEFPAVCRARRHAR